MFQRLFFLSPLKYSFSLNFEIQNLRPTGGGAGHAFALVNLKLALSCRPRNSASRVHQSCDDVFLTLSRTYRNKSSIYAL